MRIEDQFNFIADHYDSNRKKFIPCFCDFYENTTDFIASNIHAPKRILDLGSGTGLLTYFWQRHFPDAQYLLLDIADEMLDVARKRFFDNDQVSFQVQNYIEGLPDGPFDTVISALSIHHLEDKEKAQLFSRIYQALPDGGLFVNYDQFCAGSPEMNLWYDCYWENQLKNSGLSGQDIELWKERRNLDRECSVGQELEMLKKSGFHITNCVYSHQKFSVIVALK